MTCLCVLTICNIVWCISAYHFNAVTRFFHQFVSVLLTAPLRMKVFYTKTDLSNRCHDSNQLSKKPQVRTPQISIRPNCVYLDSKSDYTSLFWSTFYIISTDIVTMPEHQEQFGAGILTRRENDISPLCILTFIAYFLSFFLSFTAILLSAMLQVWKIIMPVMLVALLFVQSSCILYLGYFLNDLYFSYILQFIANANSYNI